MKIGYFSEKFPYFSLKNESVVYPYGGGEIVAYYLAINIAKRGHSVYVFTTSVNSKSNIERKWGINIYRYGTSLKVFRRNISFNLLFKPNTNVDIVHAHICSEPFSLIAALRFAKRMKVPLVVTYHGDTIKANKSIAHNIAVNFHNSIVEKILNFAKIIILPSRFYVDESKFLRKYRDKIIEIPNGIDIEKFSIPYSKDKCREILNLPKNKFIILFLSVLHPRKGPDVILRAMPIIIEHNPNVKLMIAGNGVMKAELKRLSRKFGIEKYVKFVGFVEESLKPFYYKSADVFCLPSVMKTEVFPVVLLEASAAGLPMVVSDLNTFKCIIKEEYNGLFTRRGDEKDLADAIIYLLENEDVRKKMGRNAKKHVKNYTWDKIAEMTEKVYREVIENY